MSSAGVVVTPEPQVCAAARGALHELVDLIERVSTLGSEHAITIDQARIRPLDSHKLAKDVQHCQRELELINGHVYRIEGVYGGPEGVTGYASPVSLALDHARAWEKKAAGLVEDVRTKLLVAVADDLGVDYGDGR